MDADFEAAVRVERVKKGEWGGGERCVCKTHFKGLKMHVHTLRVAVRA